MDSAVELTIQWGVPLLLLVLTYFTGTAVERSHFRSIRIRESRSRRMPATTFRRIPSEWRVERAGLVCGSVVVSIDYFKRFLAGLRGVVGGRVRSYEALLDRARREAVLRVKEAAFEAGYDAVINLRLETSRMASSRRDGKGTAGVEVLAFATGIARHK